MAENFYQVGSWYAAVGPRVAVLVSGDLPQAALETLWRVVLDEDAELADVLGALAPQDAAAGASYGAVVSDGSRVWLHVRSGTTAALTDQSGHERIVDSGGISTRVEYDAADVAVVTLARAGAGLGGPLLPISTGVVPADSVSWQPAPPDELHDTLINGVPTSIELPLAAEQPPAPPAGSHDGYTIARSAVTAMRAAEDEPSAAARVQAITCPRGHVNSPEAALCRICEDPLEPQEPIWLFRPSLGLLRFSTGQVVELDRRVVVGRSPSVERVSGDELPQLVQVDSPDQDVSRSHAEVRLEGWRVLVVDLDSVNGTVVTAPGRPPERLNALEPYPLVPGAVVDLAGEVTFEYDLAT